MCVLCTVYPPPPLRLKLVQDQLSALDISKVWGKWYGLAECLIFHIQLAGWGWGGGVWQILPISLHQVGSVFSPWFCMDKHKLSFVPMKNNAFKWLVFFSEFKSVENTVSHGFENVVYFFVYFCVYCFNKPLTYSLKQYCGTGTGIVGTETFCLS